VRGPGAIRRKAVLVKIDLPLIRTIFQNHSYMISERSAALIRTIFPEPFPT